MQPRMKTTTPDALVRRVAPALLCLAALLPASLGHGQIERYVAGTHYTELQAPVNTNDASKIEVIEVFWYGCSHCFRFEPLVNDWAAQQPDDVDFVLFPAMWNSLMEVHARIYYTAEALDVVDEVHETVFNAINVEGNRLQNERQISALFAARGVDEEEFEKAYNSFSVRTRINQTRQRMQDYQIVSTPNMVVNGKYLISTGENVPTQQEMLNVVDFLVEKERAAMAGSGD